MLKKFTAVICTLSLLTVPHMISAAETDGMKENILKGLGIVTETRINKEIYINSLGKLMYADSSLFSAEEIARQSGMIDENEGFKSSDSITVNDATKYAVIALGYKVQADLSGNYTDVAARIGLLKGISESGEKRLTKDISEKILYNMLDIPPLQKVIDGTGEGYWTDPDSTLLELNHDIYKIYGIVTADTNTSLYSDNGRYYSEYVLIDGTEYLAGESNAELYLGHSVVAYVKELPDGDKEIVYICDRAGKNDVFEIEADEIENIASDFSYIEYYEDEKLRKVKIDDAVSVIYNGVSFGGYTEKDLMPDVGRLALVDNDADGKYDVISVTSYETVLVSFTDSIDYTLNNKFTFDGSTPEFKFNEDEINLTVYSADGSKSNFEAIKSGDIISIAKSKDGSVVRVYISGDKGTAGTVTGINKDTDKIEIDGNSYSKSKTFDKYTESVSQKIEIGKSYIFYTDYFGNIAYMENVRSTEYVLVQKMYEDDETYRLVYMDMNGTWYTTTVGSKITVDGKRTSDVSAYDILRKQDPQLMKITLNSKGEVNTIDIAELSDVYLDGQFTKTAEKQYTYRTSRTSLGMVLYPTTDAIVVVIPQDETDKDGYYIRKSAAFFGSDKDYNVTAYDVDDYGCVSVMTVKETEESIKSLMSKSMFVVTDVYERLEDGEVLPVIKGYVGVYKNLTVVGADSKVFEGINRGDIINININTRGKADFVTKVTTINTTNYYQRTHFLKATVISTDFKVDMIKFLNGSTVSTLRLQASVPVIFYDSKENECRDLRADSLKPGDEVIMRSDFGNIIEMVCIR